MKRPEKMAESILPAMSAVSQMVVWNLQTHNKLFFSVAVRCFKTYLLKNKKKQMKVHSLLAELKWTKNSQPTEGKAEFMLHSLEHEKS